MSETSGTSGASGTGGAKVLIRPRTGRMIAGVCAGLGNYFGIDATIVRLVFVAFAVMSAGAGALVYLIAWAVVPEEGEASSIAESYINKKRRP